MVRLYIQLDSSDDADFEPRRNATAEEVQAAAKKILRPYHIEWDEVRWYSVYPIAQSIAERYTLDHRVFLGGDCCHTHSVNHPLFLLLFFCFDCAGTDHHTISSPKPAKA